MGGGTVSDCCNQRAPSAATPRMQEGSYQGRGGPPATGAAPSAVGSAGQLAHLYMRPESMAQLTSSVRVGIPGSPAGATPLAAGAGFPFAAGAFLPADAGAAMRTSAALQRSAARMPNHSPSLARSRAGKDTWPGLLGRRGRRRRHVRLEVRLKLDTAGMQSSKVSAHPPALLLP